MKKIAQRMIGIAFMIMFIFVVAGCGNEDAATTLVSEFRDYIQVKDGEGLYEQANIEDGTHWTVDDAANVVTMLKDDEEKSAEIMAVLAAQGQHYDAEGDKNKAYDLYDDVTKVGPFYITEEDDEFILNARSYDVTIVTEPDATITFLDEEYVANEAGEVSVGKIGPGYYELTGTLETEDGQVEKEDSFFMFEFDTFAPTVFLEFDDED